jgi:hypothetical protein
LLFILSLFPKSRKMTGMGTRITARHPRSVEAHWIPILLNICREKSGKLEATSERTNVLAAIAEAALNRKMLDHAVITSRLKEKTYNIK